MYKRESKGEYKMKYRRQQLPIHKCKSLDN